jgi:hypothetical protein
MWYSACSDGTPGFPAGVMQAKLAVHSSTPKNGREDLETWSFTLFPFPCRVPV